MSKIAIFFAKGYEEIEALAVVDICRRAGLAIEMVSVTENDCVEGSHGIGVKMDKTYSQVDGSDRCFLCGGKIYRGNLCSSQYFRT